MTFQEFCAPPIAAALPAGYAVTSPPFMVILPPFVPALEPVPIPAAVLVLAPGYGLAVIVPPLMVIVPQPDCMPPPIPAPLLPPLRLNVPPLIVTAPALEV